MSEREEATVAFLERCFGLFREGAGRHRGELVKTTGDGALILFASATDAIEFASEMHRSVVDIQGDFSRTAAFRAGIHIGEVRYRDGDVYGHAVNVAARLESLAGSGATCISRDVYTLVHRTSRFEFEALGGHRLRNIPEHMRVYRVVGGTGKGQPFRAIPFSVATIGGLRVARHGSAIELSGRARTKGVLGYLSLSPDGVETTGRLATLFWPDRKAADARRAVSRLVRSLSEGVGIPVARDDGTVRLNLEEVTVDLLRLEQELRQGHVDPVLSRDSGWPDRILAGLDEIGPFFASWLSVVRTDWRIRIASSLELCLDLFELADDGARDAAAALVRIEPGHERAARTLIRHYHSVDNPGAAKRVYDQLAAHLDRRFGIQPKQETFEAAHGRIGEGMEETPVVKSSLPLRIHVADFGAGESSKSELAAGFRGELLASLASFRGWSVVECDQHAGHPNRMSDYVLDGVMSGTSDEPWITLTLNDANSGRIVWSDRYSLDPMGFHAAKRQALGRITATLEVYISTDRISTASPDPSHQVVDSWLQAERVFSRWTPEDHDSASAVFEKLILQEPEFAPAYASLASIQNVAHIVRPGAPRDSDATRRAYALADRAVEIDPLDARNQLAVAWSASLEGDFDKASMHMDMAAGLNPNSPRTLISCSMAFAFFGNHARAQKLLAHSLDCAPILLDYQWCYVGAVYYLAGDYTKALTAITRGRDKIIDNHGWRAATLVRLGRLDEAKDAFAYQVEVVNPIWYGEKSPTDRAVFDWFVNVYPFRRSRERNALADALRQLVPTVEKSSP